MKKIFFLILLIVLFSTLSTLYSIRTLNCSLANIDVLSFGIGFDFSKYMLLKNGTLVLLDAREGLTVLANLNYSFPENFWYEFFVDENDVYIYGFSLTEEKECFIGLFVFRDYSIVNGSFISKEYGFRFCGNRLNGTAVSSAMAKNGYLVTRTVERERYRFYVLNIRKNFTAISVYGGTAAITPYLLNDTIIAPIIVNNTPYMVDLVKGKKLYELPSLIPVASLFSVQIQPFLVKSRWKVYASSTYGTGRLYFYLTYPNSTAIEESPPASVHPLLHYMVLGYSDHSEIVFKDGETLKVNIGNLRALPLGSWVSVEYENAVLDVDINNHFALVKTAKEGKAEIYVISKDFTKKIYELPLEISFKENGFQAVIAGETVYIKDPVKGLITIPLKEEKPPNKLIMQLAIVLIGALAIITYIYFKRIKTK